MVSKFFITRPIFATVLALLLTLAGLVALPLLPIEQYPNITPPTVQVSTRYPGSDAQTLADTVTTPLEQAINGVEGMLYLRSTSADDGAVTIEVTFELGTDADLAAVRVQNAVGRAEARLPEPVRAQGVTVLKRSPSLLLVLSLVSDDHADGPNAGTPIHDYATLSNYATLYVLDPLSRADGVGDVSIFGARDYSMRVWLDPAKMEARDLTADDVLARLREQNRQVAAGRLGDQPAGDPYGFTYTLTAPGRLSAAEEFGNIVLRTTAGRAIRLKDVARVELGSERYGSSARRNGKPGAQIPVYQLPGSNAVNTVAAVREQMQVLEQNFPPGLRYEVTFDFTKFVRAAIVEVLITLGLAALLVVLVVYVFLQDVRATLIPAITIPVSLIGTLAVMWGLGFSLNLLTLFGLVLAIGIVVDDAIVVVENVARKIDERGCCAADAATDAMREVTGPIVATTLVVLAVFLPAAMLPGLTGQLYRQFAVTLSVATVLSSVNALTLSPALCAIFLKPNGSRAAGAGGAVATPRRRFAPRRWLFGVFNRGFDRSQNGYARLVGGALRWWPVSLAVYALLITGAFFALRATPTGFLPEEDQGYLFVNIQLPDAAKLDRTDAVLQKVEQIILNTDGVDSSIAVAGFSLLSQTNSSNAALGVVILKNWDERPGRPAGLILGEMSEKFAGINEAMVFGFPPPAIRGLGQSGGFEMMLQDRGNVGGDVLQRATQAFLAAAERDPIIGRVLTTFNANAPQRRLQIDRERHLKLGVSADAVNTTLGTMLGGVYVNDFNLFGRVFRVYAQADAAFRQNAGDLGRLKVRNAAGTMTPLDSFVRVEPATGPQNVVRYNLFPAAPVSGGGVEGASSGDVLATVARLADETLPAGVGYEWTGVTFQQERAGNVAPIVFTLAVFVVFLVLAAQYESWLIPLIILLAVPLGVLGALTGLLARGLPNDIYAQIGLVLLVALVAKNAILVVEFAVQRQREGLTRRDAAVEAAKLRFRPILMTAVSFVLGTVPLLLATGAGASSRQTLGTAVVFGMVVATAVGLVMTPVFYGVIARRK